MRGGPNVQFDETFVFEFTSETRPLLFELKNTSTSETVVSRPLMLSKIRDSKFPLGRVYKVGSSDSISEPKVCVVIALEEHDVPRIERQIE